MRRTRTAAVVALAATVLPAVAACTDDEPAPAPSRTAAVVASTTWVGALAKAAGATDVAVIAPANVPDPGAFQPTQEEMALAGRAEHVVYAKSDGFAGALEAAAGDAHLVPVVPSTEVSGIRTAVTALAQAMGTESVANRWLAAFEAEVEALSESLKGLAPIPPDTAVASADVAHWAAFAGVRVVAEYGPEPPTDAERAALVARRPKLLLASVHRPADTPDIPGALRVDLVNYPGTDLNLLAVFQTNGDRLGATFAK
jgi:zinc transport system substrate-binding protein